MGKATKPSALGSGKQALKRLLELQTELSHKGLAMHVIDSERAADDISLSAYSHLLEYSEGVPNSPRLVITLPVRRSDFEERFRETVEVLKVYENGGLCLVAGNPAYLNEEEASRPAGRSLYEAVGRARRLLGEKLILVGTENVSKSAVAACKDYRAVPFLLLSCETEAEASWFAELTSMPVAVYAPYCPEQELDGVAKSLLLAYAKRRKQLSGLDGEALEQAIYEIALISDAEQLRQRLSSLSSAGVKLVVGLPLLYDGQVVQLANIVNNL